MTRARLFLIVLIIVIIIALVYLFIKNVGNVARESSISSRPLQINAGASSTGVLTSLPYSNVLSTGLLYTNFAVFTANNKTPNQYFNLLPVPGGSTSSGVPGGGGRIVIQDTASGLYLVMSQQQVLVPAGGTFGGGGPSGGRVTATIGTFSSAIAGSGSVFQITRIGGGNSYQLMLTSSDSFVVPSKTGIFLPPTILAPPPQAATALTLGPDATTYSLMS